MGREPETSGDYDALLRRYDNSQANLKKMSDALNNANNYIDVLEREKKQWEQEKIKQAEIIAQRLTAADERARSLQDEVIRLRAKLKERGMTDADID